MKFPVQVFSLQDFWSPPAREVWIEIVAESAVSGLSQGHLPHGRCGLKYKRDVGLGDMPSVTSRTGGVD